jgi:hypothetical protein
MGLTQPRPSVDGTPRPTSDSEPGRSLTGLRGNTRHVTIGAGQRLHSSDDGLDGRGFGGRAGHMSERALEEFKRLNETHRPMSLPDNVLIELDRILAAAERQAE